ncbi:MAG TPA: TetR/AcrR family transcriptional regulator [Dehalococcoidia bacterium]|nr:TetR/AcrR family transcriptional regulator [Dehalococcoidia bacterium]
MPRVSAAHLTARRQQILRAAAACFARKGFHQATMQDICDEAGLSPGAVYRYFASKLELIAALCDDSLRRHTELISAAAQGRDFSGLADEVIAAYFGPGGELEQDDKGALDLELIAEASRNPEIGAIGRRSFAGLRGIFAALVASAQERGEIAPELDPQAVATMALSFYHGLQIQKLLDPAIETQPYVAVMKALLGGRFRPTEAPVSASPAAHHR